MFLISSCTVLVLLISIDGWLNQTKNPFEDFRSDKNGSYVLMNRTYIMFAAILIITSTLRFGFVDTYAYKEVYVNCRNNLSYVNNPPYGFEKGWMWLCYYLNFISGNPKLLLLICAFVIVFSYVLLIKKYSYDPLISLLLFFFLEYLSTNNGLRQIFAASIIIISFYLLEKRKLWAYILFALSIFLAIQLHNSAKVFFIIMLFVFGKSINLRVKLLIVFGFAFLFSNSNLNGQLLELFEDSKYVDIYAEKQGGMTVMRGLIMGIIPLILTIVYVYFNRYNNKEDKFEAILINTTIVNSVFIIMGMNVVFWARLAFYTSFAPVIMVPKYIDTIFSIKTKNTVKTVAVILYFIFFAYNVYVNFTYGNMDSFVISLQ